MNQNYSRKDIEYFLAHVEKDMALKKNLDKGKFFTALKYKLEKHMRVWE